MSKGKRVKGKEIASIYLWKLILIIIAFFVIFISIECFLLIENKVKEIVGGLTYSYTSSALIGENTIADNFETENTNETANENTVDDEVNTNTSTEDTSTNTVTNTLVNTNTSLDTNTLVNENTTISTNTQATNTSVSSGNSTKPTVDNNQQSPESNTQPTETPQEVQDPENSEDNTLDDEKETEDDNDENEKKLFGYEKDSLGDKIGSFRDRFLDAFLNNGVSTLSLDLDEGDTVCSGTIRVRNKIDWNTANYAKIYYSGETSQTINSVLNSELTFSQWYAIIVNKQDDNKYIVSQVFYDTTVNRGELEIPANGFILLIYSWTTPEVSSISEYDEVVLTNVTLETSSATLSNASYTIIKYNEPEDPGEDDPPIDDGTNHLIPISSVSTNHFIELNLYDYCYIDNNNHFNVKYNSNKHFPGFQGNDPVKAFSMQRWGFGAFDSNIITDLGGIKSGVTLDSNGAQGTINETYEGPGGIYGTANTPLCTRPGYDYMKTTLGNDGYPAISYQNKSLGYLFGKGNVQYVRKMNTESVDGLFRYNAATDTYYFDSSNTHAQYDEENNCFNLYNETITSSFMVYPFGNFLPFNDIQTAKKVSTIDMSYFDDTITRANQKSTEKDDPFDYLSQAIKDFKGKTTSYSLSTPRQFIDLYCTAAGLASNPVSDATINKLYNINYDDYKDFYFGMKMKFNFVQPKNGINLTNNAPIEFDFAGDDDVWIYIDGVLFLDLGGIHRKLGGKIDFQAGKVYYYPYDANTFDVNYSQIVKEVSFAELVDPATLKTDALGNPTTFKENTIHSLEFYYMERGGGSSSCAISFNLQESYIVGEKQWEGDNESTRPSEVIIDLYRHIDGEEDELYKTTTTSAEEDWMFNFDNIPYYDVNNNRYRYRIEERPIRNYQASYPENANIHIKNIVNTLRYKDVSVSKVWDDLGARSKPEVIVQLSATVNGEPYEFPDTIQTEVELSELTDWTYTWSNLELVDENLVPIDYVVTELPTEGYYSKVERDEEGNFIITNIKNRAITVHKFEDVDTTNKLGGAEFKLERLKQDENDEWIVDNTFTPMIQTTASGGDELGTTIFEGLEEGKYRLTETKAPKGFKLINSSIDVDVTLERLNFDVNVLNKKGLSLPNAGDGDNIVIVLMVAGIISVLWIISHSHDYYVKILPPIGNTMSIKNHNAKKRNRR